jgi:rod shape-determining protein MreC
VPRERTSVRMPVLGSSVRRSASSPYPSRSGNALRRRILLGVLVLLALVLVTVSFRESSGGPLHRAQGAGATVLHPFQIAAERVARPFRDVYGYFAGLVHVKRENERLKKQVNELRQQALLGEAARAQNARFRDQLNFIDSPLYPSDYRPVNTRIIGWRNEFDERVVIAAGRDNGIRQETPVVTSDGLVGSVTQVTGSSALVTLLTDENSAVQARDQDTDAFGLVRHGQGEGSLIVDRVTKDKRVAVGDVIVTAGTRSKQYPSLFPPSIPIGWVTSVGQSDSAPYKQILIQPFVDFSSLDAVTALITNKQTPKAP